MVEMKAESVEMRELVDRVTSAHEALLVVDEKGNAVKVVPVPKPLRIVDGRAIYRLEDMQFLDIPPC